MLLTCIRQRLLRDSGAWPAGTLTGEWLESDSDLATMRRAEDNLDGWIGNRLVDIHGPRRLSAQLVSIMRLLQLDGYFEGVETGTASTADSNAMNNTQGVLPRHEAVWGSFAGP